MSRMAEMSEMAKMSEISEMDGTVCGCTSRNQTECQANNCHLAGVWRTAKPPTRNEFITQKVVQMYLISDRYIRMYICTQSKFALQRANEPE